VIAWVLVGTTRDVLARLLDRVDPEVIDEVERAARSVEGVEAVHAARARWVGRSLHVLVHAEVDPDLPLRVAHDLGEQVRHAVFHALPGVAAVDLHLDPAGVDEHDSHGRTLHHRDQGSRSRDRNAAASRAAASAASSAWRCAAPAAGAARRSAPWPPGPGRPAP